MAAVQTTYTLIRNMQLVHESCLLSESGSTREGIGDVWASTAPAGWSAVPAPDFDVEYHGERNPCR